MNALNLTAPKNAGIAHRFVKNVDGSYSHYEQCIYTDLHNLLDASITHQEVTDIAARLRAHGWR